MGPTGAGHAGTLNRPCRGGRWRRPTVTEQEIERSHGRSLRFLASGDRRSLCFREECRHVRRLYRVDKCSRNSPIQPLYPFSLIHLPSPCAAPQFRWRRPLGFFQALASRLCLSAMALSRGFPPRGDPLDPFVDRGGWAIRFWDRPSRAWVFFQASARRLSLSRRAASRSVCASATLSERGSLCDASTKQ